MARPTRNNADYFTHPANFRNDRRVKAVRARFGLPGYAILLMLMEALTDADNTQLSTDELEMELFGGDFGVSVTDIYSLLQLAEKIGLFSRNGDGNLICEDLNSSLKQVFDKRNRAREVERDRQKNVSVTETPVSVSEIPQTKLNKTKEDNNMRNTLRDESLSAFWTFWDAYDKKIDRKKCLTKWQTLTAEDHQAILLNVPAYVKKYPNPQLRKNPLTYLNGENWKDPIVSSSQSGTRSAAKEVVY